MSNPYNRYYLYVVQHSLQSSVGEKYKTEERPRRINNFFFEFVNPRNVRKPTKTKNTPKERPPPTPAESRNLSLTSNSKSVNNLFL